MALYARVHDKSGAATFFLSHHSTLAPDWVMNRCIKFTISVISVRSFCGSVYYSTYSLFLFPRWERLIFYELVLNETRFEGGENLEIKTSCSAEDGGTTWWRCFARLLPA